jgi:hypothetical protein
MKNNKQDINGFYGNTNATYTNTDFWNKDKSKPKCHTYILQYCSLADKGIRAFLNEYLKNNCVLLVTCGIGGGGGCTFATEVDIDELHRVLCTYNLEFILYQTDTGKNSWRTNKENGIILDKIFGNNRE